MIATLHESKVLWVINFIPYSFWNTCLPWKGEFSPSLPLSLLLSLSLSSIAVLPGVFPQLEKGNNKKLNLQMAYSFNFSNTNYMPILRTLFPSYQILSSFGSSGPVVPSSAWRRNLFSSAYFLYHLLSLQEDGSPISFVFHSLKQWQPGSPLGQWAFLYSYPWLRGLRNVLTVG